MGTEQEFSRELGRRKVLVRVFPRLEGPLEGFRLRGRRQWQVA